MISKDNFIKVINVYKQNIEFLHQLNDLGLDLYETPLVENNDAIFDAWLNQITGEAGIDLIYWWLFEDVEKNIYMDNKIIANLEDIENLYDYMKNNGYF